MEIPTLRSMWLPLLSLVLSCNAVQALHINKTHIIPSNRSSHYYNVLRPRFHHLSHWDKSDGVRNVIPHSSSIATTYAGSLTNMGLLRSCVRTMSKVSHHPKFHLKNTEEVYQAIGALDQGLTDIDSDEQKKRLEHIHNKTCALFLGKTGSGKSTLINAVLSGPENMLEHTIALPDGNTRTVLRLRGPIGKDMEGLYKESGKELTEVAFTNEGIAICECPGFDDTGEGFMSLARFISNNELVKRAAKVRLFYVMTENEITESDISIVRHLESIIVPNAKGKSKLGNVQLIVTNLKGSFSRKTLQDKVRIMLFNAFAPEQGQTINKMAKLLTDMGVSKSLKDVFCATLLKTIITKSGGDINKIVKKMFLIDAADRRLFKKRWRLFPLEWDLKNQDKVQHLSALINVAHCSMDLVPSLWDAYVPKQVSDNVEAMSKCIENESKKYVEDSENNYKRDPGRLLKPLEKIQQHELLSSSYLRQFISMTKLAIEQKRKRQEEQEKANRKLVEQEEKSKKELGNKLSEQKEQSAKELSEQKEQLSEKFGNKLSEQKEQSAKELAEQKEQSAKELAEQKEQLSEKFGNKLSEQKEQSAKELAEQKEQLSEKFGNKLSEQAQQSAEKFGKVLVEQLAKQEEKSKKELGNKLSEQAQQSAEKFGKVLVEQLAKQKEQLRKEFRKAEEEKEKEKEKGCVIM